MRSEALVVNQVLSAYGTTGTRPVVKSLEAGEGEEAIVLRPIGSNEGIEGCDGASGSGTPGVAHLQ